MNRKPTLLLLFAVVFLDLIGFGLIIPLLPYYATQMGASGAMIGWVFASFSLMQFIFAPLWGKMSDRYGRRPLLLLGLSGSVLSYLMLAWAPTIEMVLLSRVLAGFCGANISVAHAYVADITTRENRAKGMGLMGAAYGLGFILGPVLAAVLTPIHLTLPALAAAAFSAVSLGYGLWALPESRPREARTDAVEITPFKGIWQTLWTQPVVLWLAVIGFLLSVALTQWETTFALFLHRNRSFNYGLSMFGWLLAYVGVLVVILQGGLIGRLVKRFGEMALLHTALGCLALSLGAFPFCNSLLSLLGCLTIFSVGMGLSRPVMSGVASLMGKGEDQGLVLGIMQGAASLGRVVGPVCGGWLLDRHLAAPYWLGAGLAIIAWGLVWRLLPANKINAT
jgi:MFS transporter, DHA1 family, tetracycline resistance protein